MDINQGSNLIIRNKIKTIIKTIKYAYSLSTNNLIVFSLVKKVTLTFIFYKKYFKLNSILIRIMNVFFIIKNYYEFFIIELQIKKKELWI
jgi:hypothetical protein